MKYLVLCFNFLFVIDTVYSALTVEAPTSIKIEKSTLKLRCNVSDTDLSKVSIQWKKESAPVEEIDNLKSRIKKIADQKNAIYTLEITKPTDQDQGNYTCLFQNGLAKVEKSIQVTSEIYLRVPPNVNVVEGEKLRIHCQVAGKPAPPLIWKFTPDGSTNTTDIKAEGRYSLEEDEHKIPNSILIVKDITMEDRGHFKCINADNPKLEHSTMVRVKDKYAALWPFLGIVAEVVILCAIIFIYEKKHNKAELEESDTDQSPDQKNTPDNGKDGLRHRQ